jgi:uroporphyrinogen decarboxylase
MKEQYGKQICFHGGIDNQHVLPFGDIHDVRREVRACLDALFFDRTGYILGPCHRIQVITPIENVLEMYKAAREFSVEG